jgi:multimeric flavodoxin WrbA
MADDLPSKGEMAKNLAKTAKDVLKGFLSDGKIKSDERLYNKRLRICVDCEFCTDDMRCEICGCFLEKKARLLRANCQKKKW